MQRIRSIKRRYRRKKRRNGLKRIRNTIPGTASSSNRANREAAQLKRKKKNETKSIKRNANRISRMPIVLRIRKQRKKHSTRMKKRKTNLIRNQLHPQINMRNQISNRRKPMSFRHRLYLLDCSKMEVRFPRESTPV